MSKSTKSERQDAAEVFPERLNAAREVRGLSQGELASRAGVPSTSISHFETGSRTPSFNNLAKLANALDVSADYLLGRAEDLDSSSALPAALRGVSREDVEQARRTLELLAKAAESSSKR